MTKKLFIIAVLLLVIIYLNGSYAYFFSYLGTHEVITTSEVVAHPYSQKSLAIATAYFYLPMGSINTGNNARYFALGDSLTRGVGVSDDKQAYPFAVGNFLAQRKRIEYANLAIPGSTTADLLKNQLPFLGDDGLDYISLLIGMNDVLTVVGTDEFKTNYAKILDNLAARKTHLIIINIPYLSSAKNLLYPYNYLVDWRTKQFNSIIESLVHQKQQDDPNISYIDLYNKAKPAFATDASLYSVDQFHPSAKGYKLWSDIIDDNLNY